MDYNLLTGVTLLIGLILVTLFQRSKSCMKKEILFLQIFIIPTINGLILGTRYIVNISSWITWFVDKSIFSKDFAYWVFGLTIFLQLSIFSLLIFTENIRQKLVISKILLVSVILFQSMVTMYVQTWWNTMNFIRNPFCYLANILKIYATISLLCYYRTTIRNKTVLNS
jgi:hypothetical protein